jgi:hypothetical protein
MRYKLMGDHQNSDGEFENECHRKKLKHKRIGDNYV